jgi:hypothetical protein
VLGEPRLFPFFFFPFFFPLPFFLVVPLSTSGRRRSPRPFRIRGRRAADTKLSKMVADPCPNREMEHLAERIESPDEQGRNQAPKDQKKKKKKKKKNRTPRHSSSFNPQPRTAVSRLVGSLGIVRAGERAISKNPGTSVSRQMSCPIDVRRNAARADLSL